MKEKNIVESYQIAQEAYADQGVDTEKAIRAVNAIPISMHCWQGDDLLGFEGATELTGGIQAQVTIRAAPVPAASAVGHRKSARLHSWQNENLTACLTCRKTVNPWIVTLTM